MYGRAREIYAASLEEIRSAGLEKRERQLLGPQGASIRVRESDKPVLNFCANNYLGLSSHPRVLEAARKALDEYGFGLSSVRFICGTQDAHKELEGAHQRVPRHRGRHPLLVLLRRQRRPLRDPARRGGRDHLRRAQPRVDHRRHPPLQGRAPPLRPRRHGRARGRAAGRRRASALRMIATDGVFSMDGDIAHARAHLRSRRQIPRDGHGRRQPRHRLHRQDRARHDRALRRASTASTSSPPRWARRWAGPRAASPPAGARSSICCASARAPTCSRTRSRRRSSGPACRCSSCCRRPPSCATA